MKKILFLFVMVVGLFANGFVIKKKSADYYKFYEAQMLYNETEAISMLVGNMLKNEKFKKYIQANECGRVSVILLMKRLKEILDGGKKHSNTEFDNNFDLAGVKKIYYDYLHNNLFDITTKEMNEINENIKSSAFFVLAEKTNEMINHVDINNVTKIMRNFVLLFSYYVHNIDKSDIYLVSNFNMKIKNELLKNYRIEINGSIKEILNIFKKIFDGKYKLCYMS